jgi:NodT family efflux transporter outer membrane factor (OMF) lipoprotein
MKFGTGHITAALTSLLLSACATPQLPKDLTTPAMPAHWSKTPQTNAVAPQPTTTWWQLFHDSELDSLIQRANQSAPDIKLVEARLREARAQLGIASARLQPAVNATAAYTRERESINAPAPVTANTNGQFESNAGQAENLFQAGFDASWELDVFGGRHLGVDAAQADVSAAIYERGAIMHSLFAEIARTYITLREYQQLIALAQADLERQQLLVTLQRTRFVAGVAADQDVSLAIAQANSIAAQLPALTVARKQAMHRLATLLGQPPEALTDELSAVQPIPMSNADLALGLPSDLLRQRPDIRRAEFQLKAATARLGAAQTDIYPHFSLNGAAGLASISAFDFFNSASLLWKIGPTITWPVFRGGQIAATIEVRDAQQQQALINYRLAILRGMEEVENAIASHDSEQATQQALAAVFNANQRSVNLAQSRYQGGVTDFREVIMAEHNLTQTHSTLVSNEAARAITLIRIYKALGSGWDVKQDRVATDQRAK